MVHCLTVDKVLTQIDVCLTGIVVSNAFCLQVLGFG